MLHDGTHGIAVNPHIAPRDQTRSPSAPEGKFVLRRMAAKGGIRLVLKGDVSKAHRRVKNKTADWALQACRLDDPDLIYLNCVGTFGIGSAAYWWHRLFSGLARINLYTSQLGAEFWQLIFADDANWMAQGPNAHILILMAILTAMVFGTPFASAKFAGGVEVEWVGYWLDVANFGIGLSERRAAWLTNWLKEMVTAKKGIIG